MKLRAKGLHHSTTIKKSLSLGSGLNRKEGPVGNDSEDETDMVYSCNESHDHDGIAVPVGGTHPEIGVDNQYQEVLLSDSGQVGSDLVHNDTIFSIGETQQLEKEGHGNSDIHLSGEYSDHTPRNAPIILKSKSLPNLGSSGGRSALKYLALNSRSSEDLTVLDLRRKEMVIHVVGTGVIRDHERDGTISNNGKNCENLARDGSNSHNYVGHSKDWMIPVMDEVNAEKHLNRKPFNHQWEELPSKDFKIKRIE